MNGEELDVLFGGVRTRGGKRTSGNLKRKRSTPKRRSASKKRKLSSAAKRSSSKSMKRKRSSSKQRRSASKKRRVARKTRSDKGKRHRSGAGRPCVYKPPCAHGVNPRSKSGCCRKAALVRPRLRLGLTKRGKDNRLYYVGMSKPRDGRKPSHLVWKLKKVSAAPKRRSTGRRRSLSRSSARRGSY